VIVKDRSESGRVKEGEGEGLLSHTLPVHRHELSAVEPLELKSRLHVFVNMFVEEVNQCLISRLGGDPARHKWTPAQILNVEIDHTSSGNCMAVKGGRGCQREKGTSESESS